MKHFQFPLETLLALRQAKLEQQEQQLALAVTDYNRKQQELSTNREACINTWSNLNGDPWKSHSDYLYLDRIEKHSWELDKKMHEARLAMEEEQKRYTDMRKDLRVLEKLHEKQYRKYKQKMERVQDEATTELNRSRKFLKSSGTIQPIG